MERRFQFSSADALWALTLAAVWCGYVAMDRDKIHDSEARLIYSLIVTITLPGAAVGALLGHRWVGFACGLASALAMVTAMFLGS